MFGAVLAIASIAFNLQFSVTNYFNFAYGELLTFGAMSALAVNTELFHLNVWVALLIGGVATGLLSIGLNRLVFNPFVRRRPQLLFALVVTFAVSLILNNIFIIIWGTDFHELSYPASVNHHWGALQISTNQILYFVIAVFCMIGLHLILNYTKLGRSMRAMSDDLSLASVCGINIDRITGLTWAITGLLAGVAGVLLAMQTHTFGTAIGDNYEYLVFSAVILGGIGKAYGALIGGFVLGLATQLSALVIPAGLSPVLAFAVLVGIMLFRPQGLLGVQGVLSRTSV